MLKLINYSSVIVFIWNLEQFLIISLNGQMIYKRIEPYYQSLDCSSSSTPAILSLPEIIRLQTEVLILCYIPFC